MIQPFPTQTPGILETRLLRWQFPRNLTMMLLLYQLASQSPLFRQKRMLLHSLVAPRKHRPVRQLNLFPPPNYSDHFVELVLLRRFCLLIWFNYQSHQNHQPPPEPYLYRNQNFQFSGKIPFTAPVSTCPLHATHQIQPNPGVYIFKSTSHIRLNFDLFINV